MNTKSEFSLFDIFQTIKNNRKQFVAVFSIIFFVGVLCIFAMLTKYQYSESFKIPVYYDIDKKNITEVFQNKEILQNIGQRYLPQILAEYQSNNPKAHFIFTDKDISYKSNSEAFNVFTLRISNKFFNLQIETSGFGDIYMVSTGEIKNKEFYMTLFDEIQKHVKEETNATLLVIKKNVENHLAELESQLKQQRNIDNAIANSIANTNKNSSLAQSAFAQQINTQSASLAEQIFNLKTILDTMQSIESKSAFIYSKLDEPQIAEMIILILFLAFFVSFFYVIIKDVIIGLFKNSKTR